MNYLLKLGRIVEVSVYEVIKFYMSFTALNATIKISSGAKICAIREKLKNNKASTPEINAVPQKNFINTSTYLGQFICQITN